VVLGKLNLDLGRQALDRRGLFLLGDLDGPEILDDSLGQVPVRATGLPEGFNSTFEYYFF
jgi:hypothetical protein